MNSHRHVAITCEELSQWAATRADDAGRLARELVQCRSEIVNLVIAAREFWDLHNDLSGESAALDKALEPFSNQVPYADDPGTQPPSVKLRVTGFRGNPLRVVLSNGDEATVTQKLVDAFASPSPFDQATVHVHGGMPSDLKTSDALMSLIDAAKAKLEAMTPEEQQAMWRAQRESWVSGEMQLERTGTATIAASGERGHE